MKTLDLPSTPEKQVYNNILESIGRTPIVRLAQIGRGLLCPLYAKLEAANPGGSVKDRIALNIVEEAEHSGRLQPGGVIVEATSGNTGVGLAIVAAIKGYKSIFVMPDKMSQEKIQLLRAYGARVVITPTAVDPDDPRSYYKVAQAIVEQTPNAVLANQYHNPENPRSHYLTTGPEIWEQTQGRITHVVIGMGTGGTITGVGRYLKERSPEVRIIGVDPTGSILKETWQHGSIPAGIQATAYKVEGIGEDFLPTTLDLSVIDEVIRVTDKESFRWARRLVREEGIFCGGSSGSALAAAMHVAQKLTSDHLVVVLLPDSGYRYLSKLFDDKWMRENGFLASSWGETPLQQVLAYKGNASLISVQATDGLTKVVSVLKENDISQIPVLNNDGAVIGLVTEVDLLKFILQGEQPILSSATIEPVIQPVKSIFPSHTPLEDVMPSILEGQAVIVTEAGKPAGILTKIDVIDFITQEA